MLQTLTIKLNARQKKQITNKNFAKKICPKKISMK